MKLEETAYSLAGDFADLSKFFSISEEPQNRWSWGHQLFFSGPKEYVGSLLLGFWSALMWMGQRIFYYDGRTMAL